MCMVSNEVHNIHFHVYICTCTLAMIGFLLLSYLVVCQCEHAVNYMYVAQGNTNGIIERFTYMYICSTMHNILSCM